MLYTYVKIPPILISVIRLPLQIGCIVTVSTYIASKSNHKTYKFVYTFKGPHSNHRKENSCILLLWQQIFKTMRNVDRLAWDNPIAHSSVANSLHHVWCLVSQT